MTDEVRHKDEDDGAGIVQDKKFLRKLGLVPVESEEDIKELEEALKGKMYVELEKKGKITEKVEVEE